MVGDTQLNAVTFFVRQAPAPRQRGTLPALGGLPEITDDIGQLHHGLSLLSIWNSLLRLCDPEDRAINCPAFAPTMYIQCQNRFLI
jgi:hypothetical protein